MSLFSAFIEALCSVSFYKKVTRSSLIKGFQYLLLWSLFTSIFVFFLVIFRLFPLADEFSAWFKKEMPIVTLAPEGITTNKPNPYEMRHPKFGHVLTVDTSKKEVSSQDMGDAILYLTATKLYAREPEHSDVRVYELAGKEGQPKREAKLVFDQAMYTKLEKTVKPIVLGVSVGLVFILFFIWKLLAALFYSIPASLINQMRSEKLPYENVLNISIFSMTASIWIFFLAILVSDIINIPFGFLGSMIVTTIYLYLGLKGTEDPEPPVSV